MKKLFFKIKYLQKYKNAKLESISILWTVEQQRLLLYMAGRLKPINLKEHIKFLYIKIFRKKDFETFQKAQRLATSYKLVNPFNF